MSRQWPLITSLNCGIVLGVQRSCGHAHKLGARTDSCGMFEFSTLTWGGAMGIRTPDLLHAISRQPVHHSASPQVTVLSRAPECALVRRRCGTSALYCLQDVAPWLPVLVP